MRESRLADLEAVLQAAYRREEQALAPLLRREVSIRGDLERLKAAAQQDQPGSSMRLIGADLAWQAWCDGRREELNRELARVLAEKSTRIGALRKALGRREAAGHLLRAERDDTRIRETRRAIEALIAQSLQAS